MLTRYEYKILKEFSKYHSSFISTPNAPYNPSPVDNVRLTTLKHEIGAKTNIDYFLIESATAKFISDECMYINSHADVSNDGLTALHNYRIDRRKAFFNETFFKILSGFAAVLSITSMIIALTRNK